MKILQGIPMMLLMCASFAFSSCGGSGGSNGSGEADRKPDPFSEVTTTGDVMTIAVGSQTIKFIYASNSTGITFPTGLDDKGAATLTRKFFMGEMAVTNALYATVLQWALDNARISETGTNNLVSAATVKFGGRELIDLDQPPKYMKISYNTTDNKFSVATGYEDHPVVYVSWYGAIMFCNWLTEMMDGNTANLVYTWVDNGDNGGTASDEIWQHGETDEDLSNTGYRLPSSDEYEYAARYRGDDPTNTVSGYDDPYFTRGNSASGAVTYYNDTNDSNPANTILDGKEANDSVAVYQYYWDGDSWEYIEATTGLAPVGSREANTLGLFDMSGNIYQWCSTERYGTNRILRGGGYWWDNADRLQMGNIVDTDPANMSDQMGFRITRTQ